MESHADIERVDEYTVFRVYGTVHAYCHGLWTTWTSADGVIVPSVRCMPRWGSDTVQTPFCVSDCRNMFIFHAAATIEECFLQVIACTKHQCPRSSGSPSSVLAQPGPSL